MNTSASQRIGHNKLLAGLVMLAISAASLGLHTTSASRPLTPPPVMELAVLPGRSRLESGRRYSIVPLIRARIARRRRKRKDWTRPAWLRLSSWLHVNWDARGPPS